MASVRLRGGEAEAAFDPGQDRVSYPVGADLLGLDPGQVFAEAVPEVVVAAGRDRLAVRVFACPALDSAIVVTERTRAMQNPNVIVLIDGNSSHVADQPVVR